MANDIESKITVAIYSSVITPVDTGEIIFTLPAHTTIEMDNKTNTLGFQFKVENITLQTIDDTFKTTAGFVTKDIIEQINEKLKAQNFKVDEASLRPKYIDDQLFIEGFAREIKEPKTVGFLSGR